MTHEPPDSIVLAARRRQFPLGASVSLAMLEDAPYTHLATLQRQEPISWIDSLGLWVVSRHADVREILLDHDRFGTGAPTSPVRMTFGTQMLSVDGDLHSRYRQAAQSAFRPATLKARLELAIRAAARGLIDEWRAVPRVDLRRCFAARLPVSTMLALAGLPAAAEAPMRDWYEIFATALASYQPTAALRAQAAQAVSELHTYLQDAIRKVRAEDPGNLLQDLVMATGADRLSDEEICRNLSIIFFGGISTIRCGRWPRIPPSTNGSAQNPRSSHVRSTNPYAGSVRSNPPPGRCSSTASFTAPRFVPERWSTACSAPPIATLLSSCIRTVMTLTAPISAGT